MRKPKRGRPKGDAKIVIYCRVDPATVEALDRICDSMSPKPTRAQLIDAALAEYVQRHTPAGAGAIQEGVHGTEKG